MRPLIDFFNHGILPFVGRAGELGRFERFWRESVDAPGLRAALVVGEAGSGKSRLVEELLPRIAQAGGLIVHTKFYPGTASSIASLVAAALATSTTARGLLRRDPEETLGATIAALQRLARLRPLLLVVEDLHLLEGDARAEFMTFLAGLSDETITLVCLARPTDTAARAIIERHLVEELAIDGLDRESVRALWTRLFDAPIDDAALDALHGVTAGTPLALRTALRAALKSGAIDRDAAGRWRIAAPVGDFASVLERNVTLLAEGMAAHLSPDERRGAVQLAALGEIFSRDAARCLVDDVTRTLELLTFKGILAPPAVTGAPLPPGRFGAQPPLAFVHTLLHRHLADQVDVSGGTVAERLVELLASDVPLYSALPYQLVASAPPRALAAAPHDRALRAIERTMTVAGTLDRTTEWPLGGSVLEAAAAITAARADWPPLERRALDVELMRLRLELMRRDNSDPAYVEHLERLFALTADPIDEPIAETLLSGRLSALRYRFALMRRSDPEACRRIQDEIEQLVERHPWLRFTERYLDVLETTAQSSGGDEDRDIVYRAERWLSEILASDEAAEEFRTAAFRRIAPSFLWVFATQEGLDERLRMLDRLEALADPNDFSLQAKKAAFLQGLGRVDETLAVLDRLQPRLRDHGHFRQYHSTSLLRLYALGWRTDRVADLEALAERLIAEAPPLMSGWMRERAGVHLVRIGLLHDEPAWARSILERYVGADRAHKLLHAETTLLLAGAEGNIAEVLREIHDARLADAELAPVIAAAIGEATPDRAELREQAAALLAQPVLTRDGIARVLNTIDIIEHIATLEPYRTIVDDLRAELHDACVGILEWLDRRSLAASIRSMLRLTATYVPERERAAWLERIEVLEQRQALASRTTEPPRLRIAMLGAIEVSRAGETPVRVRGARLRTLLGLMAADRMLDRPLSLREFQRVASGGEEDPERARKTTSMGVLRLRETIGAEAVLTDGETPRLDPALVSVDLVEAHERLEQVAAAVEERSWVQATRALNAALDITRGQVPFPGLYEEFFEAARDDFEYALRTAILNVARGLLIEGDPATAADILARGFDAMPEDDELAELLQDALTTTGRRTDAERVKGRSHR